MRRSCSAARVQTVIRVYSSGRVGVYPTVTRTIIKLDSMLNCTDHHDCPPRRDPSAPPVAWGVA